MSKLIVGLTGSIGSGKTTISTLFNSLYQIDIIDADVISRDLLKYNSRIISKISNHFGGKSYINGELNKAYLREIIFNNLQEKLWLENLTHPEIIKAIKIEIKSSKSQYIIVSAPLLIEANIHKLCNRILLVNSPIELQLDRVSKRDNINSELSSKILSSQISFESKLQYADDTIDNSLDLTYLTQQVKTLNLFYTSLNKKNVNNLEESRKEIISIDNQIVELLNKRMNLSKIIAFYKRDNNLEVEDLKREYKVIQNLIQSNKINGEKINNNSLKKIYSIILKESKDIQKI
ncbi:MAG: dephospho-CoA kinase [Psittacicella sp.]